MPLALMVPSADGDTVQATPTVELTTVGVNCTVPPILIKALAGVMVTLMGSGAVTSAPMRYVVSKATAFEECP